MSVFIRKAAYTVLPGLLLLPFLSTGCADDPVAADEGIVDRERALLQETGDQEDISAFRRLGVPFADAEVFFELNTTDNDLGLQVFLDAEGWRQVKVGDPAGQKIAQIMAHGPLAELGITELRFESAEPSPAEVLGLFPPGEYVVTGKGVEGELLFSEAELSHTFIPAFTFSPSEGQVVDPSSAVVTWDVPGAELMEVILESEESDNVFDVIVSGEVASLDIPSQFLEPDTEYKIELLAYHEDGNRTIVESTFLTSG